jgi:protocatechuate 3,4-dioxygenase beta subunit
MKRLIPTAEMTLGPFFPREFAEGADDLAGGAANAIEITGRVTELEGKPLDNVILEI